MGGHFRPIVLINSSMIISRVLTNKLSPLMDRMVGDYQSGFIKGRSILEGMAITKKVIHQCRRTSHDGYLLKLDFEKAYDSVSGNAFWKY